MKYFSYSAPYIDTTINYHDMYPVDIHEVPLFILNHKITHLRNLGFLPFSAYWFIFGL